MKDLSLKQQQLALIKQMGEVEKFKSGKPKANEMQKIYDQIINLEKQIKNETNNDRGY